ncbi:NAD(P)H-dependent oxidoreductase [Corynebacterium sp. 22KM0430]|nr:NAD(P)H-dependent oxidoreductase [Corynebacterium sp. 22KM0430]WPF66132.1 NAD(P)H-dependent oxidoreductase [Corynebacterium sp. 22KM0430]
MINAHLNYPGWSEGTLNRAVMEEAKGYFTAKGHEVTETIIDAGYDAQEEERKHLEADVVILQTPINWFSAPWTWKKYTDEVFNVALANKSLLSGDGRTRSDLSIPYGSGGNMAGKKFMISATWNAPRDAFDNADNPVFRGKSVDDALVNISANYLFCGYTVLPSFNVFDIYKNPAIEEDIASYGEHLTRCGL